MARFLVESFSAAGGPETAVMGGDGFERGPTDPGEYLIAYCGRHQSKRYPDWSGIPWGTPLKEDKGELWVKMEGTWQKLSKFSRVTKAIVEEQHLRSTTVAKPPFELHFLPTLLKVFVVGQAPY